ncbi:MAG: heme biosynthesis protein HemY [Burkholderiales bacterium]|nr:MAG: heme biosynthesis protein HemY [Burkholderiales bacterium]
MRMLFWLFVLAALAVVAALAAQFNDGNVAIFVPPYRVDLSLNFLLLLLALLLLAVYLLARLGHALAEFPRRVADYRASRGMMGSLHALRVAVLALLEGRYARVERAARDAQGSPENAALTALLAARAAHRMQEYQRRDDWLRQAGSDPGVQMARLVSSAEMWTETRETEKAQEAVAEMQRSGGRHIHASRIALGVNAQAHRWDDVLKGVRLLDKRRALHAASAQGFRLAAYRGRLADHSLDADDLVAECRRIPTAELRRPELAAEAARLLAAAGRGEVAAELIEAALKQGWDADLVELYGRIDAPPYRQRIEQASAWLVEHANDPALLRALGLLCEREQLWGKALGYLGDSRRLQPSGETSLALARIAEATGDEAAARGYFREAALAFASELGAAPGGGAAAEH